MIKKIKETDWWEVSYLIIYAIIFSKEFLQTTMFPIAWPLGLGYVFALLSGGYVIAKFLFHNTYSKKETILAALVLIAFCVPAFTTDYTYLFWTGCLIVGAKDVDFNKILKVYLVLGITFMVAAFAASQGGLIEDLEYVTYRGEELVTRHSFGIIYPTDFAAHLFYLVIAWGVHVRNRFKAFHKAGLALIIACIVWVFSNAQTSMFSLIGFALLCMLEKILEKSFLIIEKILRFIPIVLAAISLYLSSIYHINIEWIRKINSFISGRLEIGRKAFDEYDLKLFGQNIIEIGSGITTDATSEYFFLDNSFVAIIFKYGIVALVVIIMFWMYISKKAVVEKYYIISTTVVIIMIHSLMEHHLIEVAYNPMMFVAFASFRDVDTIIGGKNV